MLDGFFASVYDTAAPVRTVTDRAFATARSHLHRPALTSLNDLVVRRADEAGLIERWCGLRVVAADASVLMPAVRPCAYFSASWTAFQADRGRHFSVMVDGVSV